MRLYLDGKLEFETSQGLQAVKSNDHPVVLGNSATSDQPFLGALFDPRFYVACLSRGELNQLAKSRDREGRISLPPTWVGKTRR